MTDGLPLRQGCTSTLRIITGGVSAKLLGQGLGLIVRALRGMLNMDRLALGELIEDRGLESATLVNFPKTSEKRHSRHVSFIGGPLDAS